jgi:phosphopantothenoylcysteine decarboxylase / phosphopantothenate---cysteine ligase
MLNKLANKNILLGVTGGIAAYKSAELIRLLRKAAANVKVIMTPNAQQFITPLTLQTLAGNDIYTDMFALNLQMDLEHIALARWADFILVAPASANFIARLAHGFADDLLATVCLASKAPIAVVPAMNKIMWEANVTQNNITSLQQRGVLIFGPAHGVQACGEVGCGRMLEVKELIDLTVAQFVDKILVNRKIVITAGPTRELIDPVRYISNFSSGKMGYAMARAAVAAGAEVTLISGPTNLACPNNVKRINVITADEMLQVVLKAIPDCNIFISVAAVADYRVAKVAKVKLKKAAALKTINLQLNSDILATVAALPNAPITIGFAAETDHLVTNAKQKLCNKNITMLVANKVSNGLGFASDDNEVLVLQQNAEPLRLAKAPKIQLAEQLIAIIANLGQRSG